MLYNIEYSVIVLMEELRFLRQILVHVLRLVIRWFEPFKSFSNGAVDPVYEDFFVTVGGPVHDRISEERAGVALYSAHCQLKSL